ncbi:hypothetical protein ACFO8O_11590 [Hephaestia sp. GCM10023244]|uniref:hypothetical protein n=1 Tax=unclassified Hephaestia TaxID=2631281 RepID=UPI0020778954|nr:hypothetical protein [Hephaestia sp. MAHUQ-44]MCM8731600.1 hypothetical protein [Hephaestia sp. MAHUQ-44]
MLWRRIAAMVIAVTLSVMPLTMANGAAMAHATPALAPAMEHCAGTHEPSSDKQRGSMIDCAIACAVVQPVAPQISAVPDKVRPAPASLPSPRLEGSDPHTDSPPPRVFPEA